MGDTKQRLAKCFETVFADLSGDAVFSADQASLAEWDSIAAITLVNVIEEEFLVEMNFEALEQLTSFDRVLAHLRQEHGLAE